jgi:glycogen(starch) synthase
MRVLMFGWEFPPHISGGLGTACFGLTSSLIQQDVEVVFVVPRLFGQEDKTRFQLISASDTGINLVASRYQQLKEQLEYIQVESGLLPYTTVEEYAKQKLHQEAANCPDNVSETNINFSGHYGADLLNEVAQYALVAAEIARSNQFDVIHAHDWLTYPAGLIARQESGKPLVIHVHATEFDRSGDTVNQAVYDIERKGMHEADSIITVSAYTRQILMDRYSVSKEKINVVYNGVTPVREAIVRNSESEKKTKTVTFLGRITFQKGPDYFVEAAKKVLEQYPETRFVMAGSGDMLNRMIKRVAALRMSSRFHFTGFLKGSETDLMYAMSDVYVMPSVSEPFGISPLEAIRSGVPVIISKQSGVSEVLKNALKIDFWDIDALADAICGLLNYKSLSQTFIREGAKEVEKLSWDRAADQTKQIYQSLINT